MTNTTILAPLLDLPADREVPWPAFQIDATGRTIFNRAWTVMRGAVADNGGPHDWLADVDADDRADVAARWRVAQIEGRPWEAVTRLRAVDRIVPVVLRLLPTTTGWYGDVVDLTIERAAVDDVEERLRTAEEAAGIGTWEVDFVTNCTRYSATLSKMLGRQGELVFEQGASRQLFHPADFDAMSRHVMTASDPTGPGAMVFEVRMLRTDGSVVWMRSSGRTLFARLPDGGRGRPLRIVGIGVDITEIRQAARRLETQNAVSTVLAGARSLSEATPQLIRAVCEAEGWDFGGIWEIDNKQRVLRCAEMWHDAGLDLRDLVDQTRVTSHPRGHGLSGKVWETGQPIAVADVSTFTSDPCAEIAAAAGLVGALAFPIVVDGEVTAVLEFVGRTAVVADPGLLEMFAAIGRQLGLFFQRQQLEAERRSLEAQLRQSQRIEAIGELSGGIAHDFNNILAAIMGNVHLALLDVPSDHPAVESLEQISLASVRAKNLVQQILTFARQRPLQRLVIAPGVVVEQSVRLLKAIVPASVTFVLDVAADVPDIVADPTQLEQVVVNLGTNAWHALESNAGQITISLRAAHDASGNEPRKRAILTVKDSGRGMSADVLERIFEPFFTTKDVGKGTGLGLSVVHGIVKSHEGLISVTSSPGAGTGFEVSFPEAPANSPLPSTPQPSMAHGGGQHVLFVDDEAPLVALNKRLLQHLGYRVSAFTSPSTALTAFLAEPWAFSLVLTDLNMPGLSGLQLATEVLRIRPDMPVLLASGYVTDEVQAEFARLGIREVLHKPVNVGQLSEALERVLS